MIIALQHVPWETMGLIEDVLRDRHLGFRYIRSYAGQRVPTDTAGMTGLVIMGGPMSVYDQWLHPHLKQEASLVEAAMKAGIPVLGICLGSQLLALVAGSRVHPAGFREIGWHPLTLTAAAREDPLFATLPPELTAFHWHGDIFVQPSGSVSLARSDRTGCQAFRLGDEAYGLLFHLEVTVSIVRSMVRELAAEWREAGLRGRAILRATRRHLDALQTHGKGVFGAWADMITQV
jgi:GMP synthase-like glutamine amidotransferase